MLLKAARLATLGEDRMSSRTPSSRLAAAKYVTGYEGRGTINRDAGYATHMRSSIWIGIFIGSTIGGLIPELWGGDIFSYSGVLLSGAGSFVGLWLGSRSSG
jgi:hypothetical protein